MSDNNDNPNESLHTLIVEETEHAYTLAAARVIRRAGADYPLETILETCRRNNMGEEIARVILELPPAKLAELAAEVPSAAPPPARERPKQTAANTAPAAPPRRGGKLDMDAFYASKDVGATFRAKEVVDRFGCSRQSVNRKLKADPRFEPFGKGAGAKWRVLDSGEQGAAQ